MHASEMIPYLTLVSETAKPYESAWLKNCTFPGSLSLEKREPGHEARGEAGLAVTVL